MLPHNIVKHHCKTTTEAIFSKFNVVFNTTTGVLIFSGLTILFTSQWTNLQII